MQLTGTSGGRQSWETFGCFNILRFCSSDDDNGDNLTGLENSSRQWKDAAEGAVECRSRDEIWRVKMMLGKKVGKIGGLNMSIFVSI
jgi:hypothetical protein